MTTFNNETFAQFQAKADAFPVQAEVTYMTDKANGHSYRKWTAAGWTDSQLIEHGYMVRIQ